MEMHTDTQDLNSSSVNVLLLLLLLVRAERAGRPESSRGE